jgi:cytochrome c-type biogenesis protein CcmH
VRCDKSKNKLARCCLSLRTAHLLTAALFLALSLLTAHLLTSSVLLAAQPQDLEDQTRAISTELRCVVCQNLSVADSPSEMAQQMRGLVREQLQQGKTPEEIKSFFVSKYGEWVLLKPEKSGFSLLVWVLPFVALVSGLGLGLWFVRRWSKQKKAKRRTPADTALVERVRREMATGDFATPDLEDSSQLAPLQQERARLYADLKELEFDFQAGKLSESDYQGLRQDIELEAAGVLQELDELSRKVAPVRAQQKKPKPSDATVNNHGTGLVGWQLVVGGMFLLVFGLVLGVALTKSLRPRTSEQDTVTGDFLTGTGSSGISGSESPDLRDGKAAFAKQDWPKAIEAFKKVLTADPNQPEAHTYMGFILVQAGHADGALMAFDKALAVAPNMPMALWGKGMTLYQAKQDSATAKPILEKLRQMMPASEEKAEVEKVLAEMSQGGPQPTPAPNGATAATPPPVQNSGQQITGTISIDPKLKQAVHPQFTLFIIARSGEGGGGPPLAVKKVDRPIFPLSYSLGAENVMMQGRPFSGKVIIVARLDKDGNAATRDPGDLTGEYKKNPVEVGSKNIDIVLDQIAK